jgi:hypothetical protein
MGLHRPFLGGLACVRLYARRKRNRSEQVDSCTKLHDWIGLRRLRKFIPSIIIDRFLRRKVRPDYPVRPELFNFISIIQSTVIA